MNGDQFLTVRQVAARFGVKSRTVRDWIRREIMPARRDQVTGVLYVPVTAVQARAAQLEPWKPRGDEPPMAKQKSNSAPPAQLPPGGAPPPAPPEKPKKAERDVVDREIWGDDEEE